MTFRAKVSSVGQAQTQFVRMTSFNAIGQTGGTLVELIDHAKEVFDLGEEGKPELSHKLVFAARPADDGDARVYVKVPQDVRTLCQRAGARCQAGQRLDLEKLAEALDKTGLFVVDMKRSRSYWKPGEFPEDRGSRKRGPRSVDVTGSMDINQFLDEPIDEESDDDDALA